MRKITELAVEKFLNMETFKMGNTAVYNIPGEVHMTLHGNVIAKCHIYEGVIELFDGGYQSNTTKERLNGILEKMGRGYVYQRLHRRFYKDEHGHIRPFNNGIARNVLSCNIK